MALTTPALGLSDPVTAALQGMSLTQQVTIGVVVAILLMLAVIAVLYVLHSYGLLRSSAIAGRRVSAQKSGPNPEVDFDRHGHPSDPLNVKIIGTRGQLAAAFAAAGWYRADELSLITSIRISVDAVLGRKYSTAPVSTQYLFGRKQDLAFERPGKSVRERDHIRFWETAQRSDNGRSTWLGAATRDIAVEISKTTHLPTHRISTDVDAERATVVNTLIDGGWVIGTGTEADFPAPTSRTNGSGDTYHTDGQRAVLTLADVFVLAVAVPSHGQLGLALTRMLNAAFRWRLPKEARALAEKHEKSERAHAAAHVLPPGASTSGEGETTPHELSHHE